MSIQDLSAAAHDESPAFGVSQYRFTVGQYHEMIETGILGENDRIELLEGGILQMSPKGPRHVFVVQELFAQLSLLLPSGWHMRCQDPLTLADSEPEPDIAIVRGSRQDYAGRHPGPSDTGLVIEVADSSAELDRTVKQRVYAAAGIPVYLLVNLAERKVEAFSRPQPAMAQQSASYQTRQILDDQAVVEIELAGRRLGEIRVGDLMPPAAD